MVANIQSSFEKTSSYLSVAAGPEPMILWPYKESQKMSPVLVSIISSFLDVVDLSWLNCLLVYCDIYAMF